MQLFIVLSERDYILKTTTSGFESSITPTNKDPRLYGYQRPKIKLFLQVPKKIKRKWTLYSGCSKYKDGGHDTYGNNTKGKIIDIEIIGNHSSPFIKNVLLVDNLKHNLLSFS